ncbi:MAG: pilus assembly protein PilP [bacterium]
MKNLRKILSIACLTVIPLLSFAEGEDTYVFDQSHIKRDPFKPLEETGDNRKLLTIYDVTKFQLVAILTGMGAPRAMIMLPNQTTEILQVGDTIGRNNGKIQKISDSEIVIKEIYKDYQGKMRSYFTSLVIAE